MKKGRVIMIITLCAFMLSGLFGCKDTEVEEPIDGGRTERRDPNAPKEIRSKEIQSFYVRFYLSNRWNRQEERFFEFTVEEENGNLTAQEKNTGISEVADTELLTGLQEIIDRHELVKNNGVYSVTAGLPPEYQPGSLQVIYASGERLYFTEDNDPYAIWQEEIYDLFARWFSARGKEDLYPEKETSRVESLRLWVGDEGLLRQYETDEEEGKQILTVSVYDMNRQEEVSEESAETDDAFLDKLTDILAAHEVVRKYEFSRYDHEANNYGNHDRGYYGFGNGPFEEEDDKERRVDLDVWYESGNSLSIGTKKPSEMEGMQSLIKELTELFSSVMK